MVNLTFLFFIECSSHIPHHFILILIDLPFHLQIERPPFPVRGTELRPPVQGIGLEVLIESGGFRKEEEEEGGNKKTDLPQFDYDLCPCTYFISYFLFLSHCL